MSMRLYKVKGVERPLRLSREHAEKIKAELYEDNQADGGQVPAPGALERPNSAANKDAWVDWATRKGVDGAADLTLEQLKAL